jgi:hypothetical protein
LFDLLGSLIEDLQIEMNELDWTMSPAFAYAIMADLVDWARENAIHQAMREPSWLYVTETLRNRAAELHGTSDNAMRQQVMDRWRDRQRPTGFDLLQYHDWFFPALKRALQILEREMDDGNVTPTGRDLTPGEAVAVLFQLVDSASKDPHFQYRTWGWWSAYPWLDFVRDEMKVWRDALKDREELPVPAGGTAFSVPG